jgi:cation diffusion facilitator family transporter
MEVVTSTAEGLKEKKSVALNSVLAAVLLTVSKIFVGILTGSLGILAEAAHSALDLIAALMTYAAVKISGKPPDSHHMYGHGKYENLSALFETLLLLATCAWIVYEAIHRLFYRSVHVDTNFAAFAVMAFSIAVDVTRSRMLFRTAKKYNSQALEADGLHFSTDIWSSSVVIFGLVCVLISHRVPAWSFLNKADAVAALLVVVIVVFVSIKLGVRAINTLVDASSADDDMTIRRILDVSEFRDVCSYHNVRHRHSGGMHFVDFHITFPKAMTVMRAHEIATAIELRVASALIDANVMAHIEPCKKENCHNCQRFLTESKSTGEG